MRDASPPAVPIRIEDGQSADVMIDLTDPLRRADHPRPDARRRNDGACASTADRG
jgi:hypothetical protein